MGSAPLFLTIAEGLPPHVAVMDDVFNAQHAESESLDEARALHGVLGQQQTTVAAIAPAGIGDSTKIGLAGFPTKGPPTWGIVQHYYRNGELQWEPLVVHLIWYAAPGSSWSASTRVLVEQFVNDVQGSTW